MFYVIFFALPVFLFDPSYWETTPTESGREIGLSFENVNTIAIALVPAGITLMLVAHAIYNNLLKTRTPTLSLPKPRKPGQYRLLIWPLLVAHFAYIFIPSLSQIASIGQLLGPAGYLAYAMFFFLWVKKLLPRPEAIIIFFVFLPIELAHVFIGGLLSQLINFGIFFAILAVITKKFRLAITLVIGAFLILLVFYPAAKEYRAQTWNQEGKQLSGLAKLLLFKDVTTQRWLKPHEQGELKNIEQPLIRRISLIVLLSFVSEKTPETVPYLSGDSYKPLLTSFVPRLIWSEKPEERMGQTFGHRYGLLHPEDKNTSINVPWIVEMYANFGAPGVLIGMTFVGFFLAFLEAMFNRPKMTDLELSFGIAILLPLFLQGSNFSLMTGSLLPLAICLWVYLRVGFYVCEVITTAQSKQT